MDWMINTQLGRRNLLFAQRLAVMDKFKKKIQEQAANKASESRSKFQGANITNNQKSSCVQKDAGCRCSNIKDKSLSLNGETLSDKKIHTDKELAKIAGVGTGTIARYNKVMNSDDEELNQKQFLLVLYGYNRINRTKYVQKRLFSISKSTNIP